MIESPAISLPSHGEGARPAQATRNHSWKSWLSTSTGVASATIPNVDQCPSNNNVVSPAGCWKSVQTVLTVSWLNLLLFVIPLAWASHWLVDTWGHVVTFLLCFIAIIPLQNIFDWCGDQIELHLQQYFHDPPHAPGKPTDPENPDSSGNGSNTDQGVDYVKDLSDFLSVTFKNLVEVTLAAILLRHCHLRLLQSTIVGLVVLHLLFIPGVAFFVGGSRTLQQILHQHHHLLNPSLLMVGALGVMLPTAYFAALDHGAGADPVSDSTRDAMLKMSRGISVVLLLVYVPSRIYRHAPAWPPRWFRNRKEGAPKSPNTTSNPSLSTPTMPPADAAAAPPPPDTIDSKGRCAKLQESPSQPEHASDAAQDTPLPQGDKDQNEEAKIDPIVCILLICVSLAVMVVTAEFGRCAKLQESPSQPEHASDAAQDTPLPQGDKDQNEEAKIDPIVCLLLICVSLAVMAVTAEFLVESIEPFREKTGIQAEWFGLVFLPFISFSPEAVLVLSRSLLKFFQFLSRCHRGTQEGQTGNQKKEEASPLAHGRPLDMSIQFLLCWMPALVLSAWWTGRPLHLLFDYYEVALLLGSCFLVICVTADGKTNLGEGIAMIGLYVMVAIVSWFYPGQPQLGFMLSCPGSVAEAVASGVGNSLAAVP